MSGQQLDNASMDDFREMAAALVRAEALLDEAIQWAETSRQTMRDQHYVEAAVVLDRAGDRFQAIRDALAGQERTR